eukprot:Ihof_evm24s11 gene=Ihof_evmTU24s11
MSNTKKIFMGWDVGSEVEDLGEFFDELMSVNGNFASLPVCNSMRESKIKAAIKEGKECPALSRKDVFLYPSEWDAHTVGKVSSYLALDSNNNIERRIAQAAMQQELGWTEHLGLPVVMLPAPSAQSVNYARTINTHLLEPTTCQYWVNVPLTVPAQLEGAEGASSTTRSEADPWQWWDQFRTICDHSLKLFVALELTPDLPSDEVLDRWLGEPVKAVLVPASLYLTNGKGFPVLSKKHQQFLKKLMKFNPQLVLTGEPGHEKGLSVYFQYFDYLHKQVQEECSTVDNFVRGYEDYLQAPLQPLMDNLESGTYEVFEKDPVKYREYEQAVYRALLDRVPEDKKDKIISVIMVVGAGRGPLVRCSMRAAARAGRKVKMYCVEKNPNAIITLQEASDREWGDDVTVVSGDMRDWKAPEKCDILVSELLGSFGDNELSPECLDGAQAFLKEDGISIPSSYTSFVSPLMSSKLHNEVRNIKEGLPHGPYDTPYVVYISNAHRIADIKPLFTFVHPNRDPHNTNERYDHLKFKANESATMHGFAGYFDTVLYKDVKLSIHPLEASEGMFSWFPIFFPIEVPMAVKAGDIIDVHFWRKCNKQK